jgi:hypothetical protein
MLESRWPIVFALAAVAALAPSRALAQTAAPPEGGGGSGILMAVVLVVGLLVVIGAAVKMFDLRRKREAEAVHLQAQVSDALLRNEALFGLPVTATAHVPTWSGSPATIELSGQVPSPELRELVLRVTREEASRIRSDFQVEDRMAVIPTMAARTA